MSLEEIRSSPWYSLLTVEMCFCFTMATKALNRVSSHLLCTRWREKTETKKNEGNANSGKQNIKKTMNPRQSKPNGELTGPVQADFIGWDNTTHRKDSIYTWLNLHIGAFNLNGFSFTERLMSVKSIKWPVIKKQFSQLFIYTMINKYSLPPSAHRFILVIFFF